MLIKPLTLLPLLLLNTSLLAANGADERAIYKWLDDQSSIHYTEYPPRDRPSEKLKTRAGSSVASEEANEKLQGQIDGLTERQQERKLTKEQQKILDDDKQDRDKFCNQIRENLKILQEKALVSELQADGSMVTLDAKQRAQRQQKIKQQLKEHCSQ